jgi:hypothetical protein
MKDLIFIAAYCPTEEQEKMLERCVDSVLKCEKHIALISHSHIPIHIQKKCQYYVYDYNNEISDDYNLLGYNSFYFGNQRIQSRFFNKYFYGFAIYRMFSIASQIAINFGYDNIHYIEYDCELLDEELINENSNFLKEYDSVIHTSNGKEDGFLFGSFKSFRVSSLPEKFKNYDKDFIQEEMKIIEPTHLEFLTKKLFINSGKVLFRNEPSEDKFKRGGREHYRNLHFTLFYNPKDKSLNIFYNSVIDLVEEITIIVNKKNIIHITTKPHHWYIKSLGVFDEIEHVRIDNSKKITHEKEFSKEFREIFKIKSYITDNDK